MSFLKAMAMIFCTFYSMYLEGRIRNLAMAEGEIKSDYWFQSTNEINKIIYYPFPCFPSPPQCKLKEVICKHCLYSLTLNAPLYTPKGILSHHSDTALAKVTTDLHVVKSNTLSFSISQHHSIQLTVVFFLKDFLF